MTILQFNHIRFLKSVAKINQLPPDTGTEVAFAGRSNAGKSSALNAITGVHGLARVSKTPGRTQLINFFEMNDYRIADLPGYGYAKVPQEVKIQWQKLLDAYVQQRESLQGLILLMDIRKPLTPFDVMMIDWAVSFGKPLHILLSKADKLNRGPAQNVLKTVQKALSIHKDLVTVQLFSALKGSGIDEAREKISAWLTVPLIEENI